MDESLPPTLALIDRESGIMSETLIKWCNINSGSDNIAGVNRMRNILEKAFSVLPAPVESVPLIQKDSGTADSAVQGIRLKCRPEAPVQIFLNGHYDTVYAADHPFQSCRSIDEDRVNGPGVADMKGGLVILLHALKWFESQPDCLRRNLGWEIFLCPDEEIGSPGSTDYLRQNAPRFQYGLCFEPTLPNGDLVRNRMGNGTFTITATGKAAHTGRDFERGRNAIIGLSQCLTAIHDLNLTVPRAIFNVGRISGGGAVNIVPDSAQAKVNIRFSRVSDKTTILNALQEAINQTKTDEGIRIQLEGDLSRPPKEQIPGTDELFRVIQRCGRRMNLDLGWADTGGSSDGNTLAAAGLPNIDTMGVRGGKIHSDEEFVILSSLPERCRLTALVLHNLAVNTTLENPHSES